MNSENNGQVPVPDTTFAQRSLAIGATFFSHSGNFIQNLGDSIEDLSEQMASNINSNFVSNPAVAAVNRSLWESFENSILTVGNLGKLASTLTAAGTSWVSGVLFYSAGIARNNQLEDAGLEPISDLDILRAIDYSSISTSFAAPSIENETSISLARHEIVRELDQAVVALSSAISNPDSGISDPDQLNGLLSVLVEARRLADIGSDASIIFGYLGDNIDAFQTSTRLLSTSIQIEMEKAGVQFDHLNPFIDEGAAELVELFERLFTSSLESSDAFLDASAALASLFSAGGAITEEVLEIFVQQRISAEEISRLPLSGEQKKILIDVIYRDEQCFGVGTLVDMWPIDWKVRALKENDTRLMIPIRKPIELVEPGDLVVSFDGQGRLVPGTVTQTFKNDAKILLNFHGTRVTPGHVYYRADSKKSHKFETLIDVLRDDGVIQHQDGTLIRAATNVPVDSPRDGFVKAVTGTRKPDGTIIPRCEGRIRLGTRFIADNRSFAVADLIKAGGGVVGEDEMIRVNGGAPMPFFWDFGDTLPKPEDFVLACSNTTLEDIYKAAEWESQGPRLPAPMVMDGGPIRPLSTTALNVMPRNEPLNLDHTTDE